GASPKGTPGSIVTGRTWEDYPLGRASTLAHISALNDVYTGVIEDFRNAIAESGKVDPMTEDILIEINRGLELFQWFLRSFITKSDGTLSPVTESFLCLKQCAIPRAVAHGYVYAHLLLSVREQELRECSIALIPARAGFMLSLFKRLLARLPQCCGFLVLLKLRCVKLSISTVS